MKTKISKKELYLFLVLFVCCMQCIFEQETLLIVEMILIIMFYIKVKIPKGFVAFIAVLFTHGIINVLLKNNSIKFLFQQLVGISISFVFYWCFCNELKLVKIFKAYVGTVKALSVIGIVQQIGYIFHLKYLYDYSWLVHNQQLGLGLGRLGRLTLIFSEPSIVAFFFAPAVYIALLSLLYKDKYTIFYRNRMSALMVILIYCMSFSAIAYLAIGIACGIIVLNNKNLWKKAFIIILGTFLLVVLWVNVGGFRERINDTIKLLSVEKIESGNVSSVVFVSNIRVTLESVKNHLGLGTGLGSYAYEYDKYIDQVYKVGVDYVKGLNREDANSLILRTLTECGFWGLAFLIGFVLRYHVSQRGLYSDISHAIIVVFILRGIRQGHYFFGEMFFFVTIYLMCYASQKNEIEN